MPEGVAAFQDGTISFQEIGTSISGEVKIISWPEMVFLNFEKLSIPMKWLGFALGSTALKEKSLAIIVARNRRVAVQIRISSTQFSIDAEHWKCLTPDAFMKLYRLNRLFNAKSNRCFDVAVDHGFFNERGFLQGIENLEKCVRTLVEAAPDAIQLTVGQAHYLQSLPGKEKPALVLRTDVANVYGNQLPRTLFSRMIEQPVEQALRLDATCVVVNLFRIPEQPEVTDQCIQNNLNFRMRPELPAKHIAELFASIYENQSHSH